MKPTEVSRLVGLCVTLSCLASSPESAAADDPTRWEDQIAAFERQDQDQPIDPGGVLFVGSSSIRGWNTDRWFPNMKVTNRGFGGSQMADVLHFVDRVVIKYKPKLVVLYEGDNDISAGKSAATVVADFKQLKQRIHAALPETKIVFLSIKPSVKRWQLYPKMKATNDQIAMVCAKDERCDFIDVSTVMLGDDGTPISELFVDDGLHMNEEGYERWTKLVRPYVEAAMHTKAAAN